MKKHLTTLFLTALILISCDMSLDAHGSRINSEITLDGTADSVRILANGGVNETIHKEDYPYTYWIGFWSGTGAGTANGEVYNISDTGFVYVTEIYDSGSRPDTTYYTIGPNNFLSLR